MAKSLSTTDKKAAEKKFVDFLRRQGVKYTKPRRVILSAVLDINEHFEAEQLLVQMRQAGSRVAKATIYRTLPLLVDCGLLRQVHFSDSQAHYEHCFGEGSHDHMVCGRCGRILEFDSSGIEQLTRKIAVKYRFHAVGHRFQIIGLCQDCHDR